MNSPRVGFGESKEKAHLKSLNTDELTPENPSPGCGTVEDGNNCDYESNMDLHTLTKVKQSVVSVKDQQQQQLDGGEYFGSFANGKQIGETSAAAKSERTNQGLMFKYEAGSFSQYLSSANRAGKNSKQGSQRPTRHGSGRHNPPADEDGSSYVDQFSGASKALGASNGAKQPSDGGQAHASLQRSAKHQEPFTFSNSLQYSERNLEHDSNTGTHEQHLNGADSQQPYTPPYNTNPESQQTVAALSLYTALENTKGHAEKILQT